MDMDGEGGGMTDGTPGDWINSKQWFYSVFQRIYEK